MAHNITTPVMFFPCPNCGYVTTGTSLLLCEKCWVLRTVEISTEEKDKHWINCDRGGIDFTAFIS